MNTQIAVEIISACGIILAAIVTAIIPILFQRLRKNEKMLRNIIAYRPGAIAYGLLAGIQNRDGATYNDQNEDIKRCLNLLLDDGYLEPTVGISYIRFSSEHNGRKLHEIVSLTPVSEELIKFRKNWSKKSDD